MKPWHLILLTAALVCGCRSTPNPPAEKVTPPEIGTAAPNGEASPFNP